MHSLAAVVLVEPLIASAKGAHSGYLKCESLRLLSLFYRGDKGNKEDAPSEEAQKAMNNSCSSVATVLKDSLDDAALHKTKNKDEVLNAVKHFGSYAKSHASSISAVDLNGLKEALDTASGATKSAGMKNAYSKLAEEIAELAKQASSADPKPPKSSTKKKKKSKK